MLSPPRVFWPDGHANGWHFVAMRPRGDAISAKLTWIEAHPTSSEVKRSIESEIAPIRWNLRWRTEEPATNEVLVLPSPRPLHVK
jgi:hypothetical protein